MTRYRNLNSLSTLLSRRDAVLGFEIQDAFFPGAVLSRATEHFMSRSGQTAVALAHAIEGAYPLVVEAGTKVGGNKRLILREADQGVWVACDSRLVSMGHGRRLLRALPPMQKLTSAQELMDRMEILTRTCTTGCLQT